MDKDLALELFRSGELSLEDVKGYLEPVQHSRGRPHSTELTVRIIKYYLVLVTLIDEEKAKSLFKKKGGFGLKTYAKREFLPSTLKLSGDVIEYHLKIWGRFVKYDWPVFLAVLKRRSQGKVSDSEWRKVKDIYWFVGMQRRGKGGSNRKWFDVMDYFAYQACYLDIVRGGGALEIEKYCEDDQEEILAMYKAVISGFFDLVKS